MPTHIGIGFSSTSDPVEAFTRAARQAQIQIDASQADLVLVFATDGYATSAGLDALHKILQPARLIGSQTHGIILKDRCEMRGVGVMAVVSDELHFSVGCQDKFAQMPARDAGYRLAQSILQDQHSPQRNAGLYFHDNLRKNGSLLYLGLREGLGTALPVVGIVGADNSGAVNTKHFFQRNVVGDAGVGLVVSGAAAVCITARHSWQPLGKPRIIDAAESNIIKIINKQPAAQIYKDYFPAQKKAAAENAAATPDQLARGLKDVRLLYPLGVSTGKHKEYLIRIPIDILDDGSIVCQGDVPTGNAVHLMITDKDSCRKTMHDAAVDIREQLGGRHPKFVLVFESFTRRKVLGRSAAQGLNAARDILGPTVPFFGMYTLGETAPLGKQKNIAAAQVLNGSFVLLAIG